MAGHLAARRRSPPGLQRGDRGPSRARRADGPGRNGVHAPELPGGRVAGRADPPTKHVETDDGRILFGRKGVVATSRLHPRNWRITSGIKEPIEYNTRWGYVH